MKYTFKISCHILCVLLLSFFTRPSLSADVTCDVSEKSERFDCWPGPAASQSACEARGCCWNPNNEHKQVNLTTGVPFCYFPKNYKGYSLTSLQETSSGWRVNVTRSSSSGWPGDVKHLTLDLWIETANRLHFKIYDPTSERYEVPISTPSPPTNKPVTSDFKIEFTSSPFGLTVYRKSTGTILFDTTVAPLIFADQFLQVSSRLSSVYLYGLGEHKTPLLHNVTSWQRMALWAKDSPPVKDSNLYGSHPIYLNIEQDSNVHGVFLLNSNAMDIDLQPLPAVTFRPIGGILDFYIFSGPMAEDVVQQYVSVIGRPQMPPYWALGFHLCRYNYNSAQRLKFIIERNRKLQIPYEVQWNDIDYMSLHRDWTYDNSSYAGLPDIIHDLHDHGQKYMIIVDPGISNSYTGQYKPYDLGLAMKVFVQNASSLPMIGSVWPGPTAFPDFTHPSSHDYWSEVASDYHKVAPFDGLWIDMNEPSNFVSGSVLGCTSNNLDEPPYVPAITGSGKLYYNTLCPSGKHYLSSHYNLHNMYGLTEANATNTALHRVLGKRSLVISRSSYPTLGRYGGHWTGDIWSNWEDLYYSIPAILEFQFYGIPMVGADICGFQQNTTEELCTRWMQLGAFYPFMRNHNDDVSIDQDPAAWSANTQNTMKFVLELRYALLPFMYTRFFESHVNGTPVIRPLFFQYPMDVQTYSIDAQFLWGSSLLISPALYQNQVEVEAYFPNDLFYDIYDGSLTSNKAQKLTLKSPLDKINVHVRGGSIVPMQYPAVTTVLARKTPFILLIAFNKTDQAVGNLYLDDGETLDSIETEQFVFMHFIATKGNVKSVIEHSGYHPADKLTLEGVRCLGVPVKPSVITANGHSVSFEYIQDVQELLIRPLQLDLLQEFTIVWN